MTDEAHNPSTDYEPPSMAFNKAEPAPLAICGNCRQAYNAHVPGRMLAKACGEFRPLTVEELTPEERAQLEAGRTPFDVGETRPENVDKCPVRPVTGDLSCVRNAGHRGLHRNFQGIEWRAPETELDTATPAVSFDDAEDLKAAVYQAVGAASASWRNLEGAGVFEDQHATRVAEALLARIDRERPPGDYPEPFPTECGDQNPDYGVRCQQPADHEGDHQYVAPDRMQGRSWPQRPDPAPWQFPLVGAGSIRFPVCALALVVDADGIRLEVDQ